MAVNHNDMRSPHMILNCVIAGFQPRSANERFDAAGAGAGAVIHYADLMHDTHPHLGFWINRFNRIREVFEAIDTGYEDIFHVLVFQ